MLRMIMWSAALASLAAPAVAAPDCSPNADEIDPRCYGALSGNDDGPALQQAVNVAVQRNVPLHLIHAHFVTREPLVIDYGQGPAHGQEGFLLKSDGATIDGTRIGTAATLRVICSGGSPATPKGCFYFHQQGTLFVNGNTPTPVFRFGKVDYSDAHNSPKIEHLVVNNGGDGPAAQFGYALDADMTVIADSAGSAGMWLGQVQMSTIRGAASAARGTAIKIGADYNFGDVILSPDLEASHICVEADGGSAHDVTLTGGQIDCPIAFYDPAHVLKASGYNLGGAVTAGTAP
jgi:hypothetical protein